MAGPPTASSATVRAAALRHRRLGRRRQVDADRPAAVRLQADPRRPARARRGASPQRRGDGYVEPRAAHRRPARRARAGHHDRRRLPLLPRPPRRKFIIADTPGPRAVHAQHGHRRLDRRPRAGAGRRAQRAWSSSRAATPSSPRCCGIPHLVVCVNKMDLVDWDEERFDAIVEEFTELRREARHRRRHVHPDLRAARRQRGRALRRTCPGTTGPPLLHHLEHVAHRLRPQPRRRAASRCSG